MATVAQPPHKVSSEILDRQPPADVEAEVGVLGSMILKPDCCDDLALLLRAEDFYDETHSRLFAHLLDMHDSGKRIDSKLLVNRLQSAGDLEFVGGVKALTKLVHSVPNAAHAVYYANIVREKAMSRSLINASTEILRSAYEPTQDSRELLNQAEQKIFSILDNRGSSSVSPIRDVMHKAMDRLDARMQGDQTQGGVDTHFTDLDELTGGLHNSELIILAARPSMGKTALALNIGENVALQGRLPVLFVSLEMSSNELADRRLCSIAKVNGHRLRNGTISNADQRRLVEHAGQISQAPLYIDDSPSRTVTEIAAAARRIRRREERLGLIVIDYLQLLEPDNPKDPRQEQVAKIARRLKGLARELEVPVLCLAQLNRQAEDSRDHKPRLSHLRESGAIEQDADVVMFVHREEYYHRGEEQAQYAGQAELIISKQRNGPVGDIPLVWEKQFTRFADKAPERLEAFDDYNDQFDGEF